MSKRSIVLALAAALLVPMPAPAANACGPATAFENDDVKIWFQGFKGHFKIDNKANGLSYDVQTEGIVEQLGDETAATMNLQRAFPKETDTCTVEEADGVVTVTFSVTAHVRPGGDDDSDQEDFGPTGVAEARATFVVHFDTNDSGAKFDLLVDEWPWHSEDGELAFDLDLTAGDGTTAESADNGVGFRDEDGEAIGSFSWDSEFTTRYEDEHEETGTVESSTATEGSDVDVRLTFADVSSGYDSLIYDPWMGVGEYLVIAGILINGGPVLDVLNLISGLI